MRMKKLFGKLLLIAGGVASMIFNDSFAQQDPQFTMYYFNPLVVNPAVAGSRDALSITLLGRKQWTGLRGAPETGTLSLHTPFKNEAFAMGFTAFYDQIAAGATKTTSLFLDGAYRLQFPNSTLSFGVKGGIRLFSGDYSKLKVIDPNDPIHQTKIANKILPNFGAGVYWYGRKFYVGLSAPKVLDNKLSTVSSSKATEERHYFLTGGYTFKLSSVIDMLPSLTVKAVGNSPISIDGNLNFLFYEKLWIGGGYRLGDAAVANVLFHFTPLFRAGYAYDYSLSDLGQYNGGSHEIMINYDLDFLGKGLKHQGTFNKCTNSEIILRFKKKEKDVKK